MKFIKKIINSIFEEEEVVPEEEVIEQPIKKETQESKEVKNYNFTVETVEETKKGIDIFEEKKESEHFSNLKYANHDFTLDSIISPMYGSGVKKEKVAKEHKESLRPKNRKKVEGMEIISPIKGMISKKSKEQIKEEPKPVIDDFSVTYQEEKPLELNELIGDKEKENSFQESLFDEK